MFSMAGAGIVLCMSLRRRRKKNERKKGYIYKKMGKMYKIGGKIYRKRQMKQYEKSVFECLL